MKSGINTISTSRTQFLLERLSDLRQRLLELSCRQIKTEAYWSVVDNNIALAHQFFNHSIEILNEQAGLYEKRIQASSSSSPQIWNERIDLLYQQTARFRRYFVELFQMQFTKQLYLYLLMQNMLATFPPEIKLLPHKNRFVIIPSGAIQTCFLTWKLWETIDWTLDGGLTEKVRKERGSSIICFECDPEETLRRQVVLAHEIVHILIISNIQINKALLTILQTGKKDLEALFRESDENKLLSYLKELFCDFVAAWQFGPAFAYSFRDEIVLTTMHQTEEHPQRLIRAKIILSVLAGQDHKEVENLRRFIQRHRSEFPYKIDFRKINLLSNHYRKIVGALNLPLYKYSDGRSKMAKYFENNIPYIYSDVREFLNNLMEKQDLSPNAQAYYDDLILESIRKTALWSDFSKNLVKEGNLFPQPPSAF